MWQGRFAVPHRVCLHDEACFPFRWSCSFCWACFHFHHQKCPRFPNNEYVIPVFCIIFLPCLAGNLRVKFSLALSFPIVTSQWFWGTWIGRWENHGRGGWVKDCLIRVSKTLNLWCAFPWIASCVSNLSVNPGWCWVTWSKHSPTMLYKVKQISLQMILGVTHAVTLTETHESEHMQSEIPFTNRMLIWIMISVTQKYSSVTSVTCRHCLVAMLGMERKPFFFFFFLRICADIVCPVDLIVLCSNFFFF